MKLVITILLFLTSFMKIIHGDQSLATLVGDPFENSYLKAIFKMDKKALMNIPKLDDETFLTRMDTIDSDSNDLVMPKNSGVLDDIKLDEEIMSQRSMDDIFEDVVVAGPITVNYVKNLMVLSSKKDFAFPPSSQNITYRYIKYRDSYRTTLVQVANEIYNTFITAHVNMNRIQLSMSDVPRHLTTILRLITTAGPRLIKSMLPAALRNIERIATECADLANNTLKSYGDVSALLQEVTEATTYTYGFNTDVLDNIKDQANSSVHHQSLLNDQLINIREQFKEARLHLEKARNAYYDAFHGIPGQPKFFGIIAAGLIGGIVGGGLTCIFTSCGSRPPPIDNSAFENAKATAELALKALRDAEAVYDKCYSAMLEKQNTLAATMMQIAQLNMNTIEYHVIIDILISATKEIGNIQEQWTKLTEFFSTLSIRAEVTQDIIIYDFVNLIEENMLANEPLDDADREFFVTQMREAADEIDRGAHLLYIMAKTYYDVSNQYMIDQISGVAGLTVTQTDDERQKWLQQLANETLTTSAKVSRMALEKKQQYEQRNRARQQEYSLFIQEIMSSELESIIGK